jgi:hypothetical protein
MQNVKLKMEVCIGPLVNRSLAPIRRLHDQRSKRKKRKSSGDRRNKEVRSTKLPSNHGTV